MLLSTVFFSVLNYSKEDQLRAHTLSNIQVLTELSFISNSTTFLEHRNTPYKDFSNKLYPEMKLYNYQEFVYAQ